MGIYHLQLSVLSVSVQLNTVEILEIKPETNDYLLTCSNKVRALCILPSEIIFL